MAKSPPASVPAPASADNLPVGHVLKGSYEVQKYLGEGGAGAVYLADHIQLGHQVAIKTLFGKFVRDQHMKQRFVEEGIIQANLNHRNIVRVTDIIDEPPVCAIIMEYVEGSSLDGWLKKRRDNIDVRRACDMFVQILDGAAHAHSKGVVHRDIKPANILLHREENGGIVPKLTDFGIAKITAGNRHTETGTAMGTIYYAPPEQLTDAKSVDHRADIYALGCTFFEMLCGQVPFSGESMYSIMRQHIESSRPDVTHVNQNVPRSIALVLKRAMAVDPAQRFQSADEFKAAVVEAMASLAAPAGDSAAAVSSSQAIAPASGVPTGRTVLPADPLVDPGFVAASAGDLRPAVRPRSAATTGTPTARTGQGLTQGGVAGASRTSGPRTMNQRLNTPDAADPDTKSLRIVNAIIVLLAIGVVSGLYMAMNRSGDPPPIPVADVTSPIPAEPQEQPPAVPAADGSAAAAAVPTDAGGERSARDIAQACRELNARFSPFIPTADISISDAIGVMESERAPCAAAFVSLSDGTMLETLESDLKTLQHDLTILELKALRARTGSMDPCMFAEDCLNRITTQLWSVHGAASNGSLYDWQVSQVAPFRTDLQQRYVRIQAQYTECLIDGLPEELAPPGYQPPAPPPPPPGTVDPLADPTAAPVVDADAGPGVPQDPPALPSEDAAAPVEQQQHIRVITPP